VVAADLVLVWQERAAERSRDAESGEEIRAHLQSGQPFGRAAGRERRAPGLRRRQTLVRASVATVVQKVGGAHRELPLVEQDDQSLGVGVRQRLEQHRVQHGKDGAGRAGPDREGQDRGKREARRLAQRPHGKPQVLKHAAGPREGRATHP
jgi:hypothetical protein